ncbi:uncharacterized protein LOC124434903 isoform X2 [Xenia sp. Carnegie-2017]|uniref:uncharacterized protein LOC124434903 isoform X2 n=1 Tax=Xenia sp. Carnegie-2017 TaxID=2897299 RepID=UPI001F035309|nr:uncharacterized protein LOC124434903 isoform X2 [Xenia sp. Carnegie-2017]
MKVYKAVEIFFCFLFCCGDFVCSMEEPVVTRANYDILHYANCDGLQPRQFNCQGNSERFGDPRICHCRCEGGYLAYRDPAISYVNDTYSLVPGKRRCIWHSYYDEGCNNLHKAESLPLKRKFIPVPTILDLTKSGSVELLQNNPFKDAENYCLEAFIQRPGEVMWTPVDKSAYEFRLNRFDDENIVKFNLSWTLNDKSMIYAYQGLIMKINFSDCDRLSKSNCLMAKVAGTYIASLQCTQRTTSGRCCVFPFVYLGKVYNNCSTIPSPNGKDGVWCAVSSDKSVDSGNHRWWDFCVHSTTPTTTFRTLVPSPRMKSSDSGVLISKSVTLTPSSDSGVLISKSVTLTPSSDFGVLISKSDTLTPSMYDRSSDILLPPTVSERSDDSGEQTGTIVGVVLACVVFVLLVAVLAICYKRRRSNRTKTKRKSVSKEDLAESTYQTVTDYSSPKTTNNRLNHGFQSSIELTDDKDADVIQHSYLGSKSKISSDTHFYDNLDNFNRANINSSFPVYSTPEADYSLVARTQSRMNQHPSPISPVMVSENNDPSTKHLYSALERDHDPLKHPEPIDNDTVFVESNPIYGMSSNYESVNKGQMEDGGGLAKNKPPSLPQRIYDEPASISSGFVDQPGPSEMDV